MKANLLSACVALAAMASGAALAQWPASEDAPSNWEAGSNNGKVASAKASPTRGQVAQVRAVSKGAQIEIPSCRPEEFLYWVLMTRDDGSKLHIEVTPLKGGEVEAFDVVKPGHTLYEKQYRKGALVCRALPAPPAGG